MEVRRHRIAAIWHKSTSNVSTNRIISPRFIALHYTTGWNGQGSLNWLLGRAGGTGNAQSSAHVVIDRDGSAWQICPFNRRAWHAGPSRYGDVSDLNSHAIGIEFVNPGWLKPDGRGGWIDGFGTRRSPQQLEEFGGFIEARHPRVGGEIYAWPLFPEVQIQRGLEICEALIAYYPIRAMVTHEEIDTRGWKTDPGPAFPLGAFQSLVEDFGRDAQSPIYRVNATRLNLRGGPGIDYERIDPPGCLPQGTLVQIQRSQSDWAYVEVIGVPVDMPGLEVGVLGWAHAGYLTQEW
ncbi:MAG: N-acetylmuramoyl-L-alanine amidase [Candidatus Competibacterales bacterium]|nr:N-acetylmuramoyl-L-alanine amidase [Candidatus Competibacterales bacterium]